MNGDEKSKLKRSKANIRRILEKKIERFRRKSPVGEGYLELPSSKILQGVSQSKGRSEPELVRFSDGGHFWFL